MKKNIDYVILFFLSIIFIMIFKYSDAVKESILSSLSLWAMSLIPSMLPIYIILDLLINYGLLDFFYRLFKNNAILLVFISLISGTPTNVKYIKEFYEKSYISKDTANFLLLFAYSPNPLFVLAFSPNVRIGILILIIIYLTNFFIFLLFKPQFALGKSILPKRERLSFIDCLSSSIASSTNILILILGVVVVYGILNTLLGVLNLDSLLVCSILEITNGLVHIKDAGFPLFWLAFACLFGGLSIHTQIKSILENTDLSYRYFLIGRLIASIPLLLLALFY